MTTQPHYTANAAADASRDAAFAEWSVIRPGALQTPVCTRRVSVEQHS
jgi:hypothetical protein